MIESPRRPGPTTGSGPPPLRRREILVWLAVFVVTRLLLLLTDTASLHRLDELYAGAAALELEAGRAPDLARLAWDPYSCGSLVIVTAAAALFRLLGPTAFALKCIALGFSTATFGVWLILLGRVFGRRPARLTAWLLVLAPPMVQRLNLMAWGNHPESALPTAAALLAAAALAWPPRAGRPAPVGRSAIGHRLGLAATAGVLASLSVFFSLIGVLAVATVALIILLHRLGPGSGPTDRWLESDTPSLAGLIAGSAVGIIPWLWFNQALGFAHAAGVLRPSMHPHPGQIPAKCLDLLAVQLPSYLAPRLDLGTAAESLFAIAVLVAAAAAGWRFVRTLARRRELPVETLLVVYPALFVLVYGLTGFFVGPADGGVIAFRYLPPLTPFLLASLGVGLAHLPRPLAGIMLLALVVPNAIHSARLLPAASRLVFQQSGASYLAWGWHLDERVDHDLVRAMAAVARVESPQLRRAAARGVATGLALADRVPQWPDEFGQRLKRLERYLDRSRAAGRYQPIFSEHVGHILATGDRLRLDPAQFDQLVQRLAHRPPSEVDPIVRAAVVALALGSAPESLPRRIEALPDELRGAGLEGLGRIAARRRGDRPGPPPPALGPPSCPAERRSWWVGYGFEWAWARLVSTAPDRSDTAPRREPGIGWSTGVNQALEWFEPEDPVRRRALAQRRLGLDAASASSRPQ